MLLYTGLGSRSGAAGIVAVATVRSHGCTQSGCRTIGGCYLLPDSRQFAQRARAADSAYDVRTTRSAVRLERFLPAVGPSNA